MHMNLQACPDFNPVSIEAASLPDADPWLAYAAEKTFTEKVVVEFGEKHPEIDISISAFFQTSSRQSDA